MKRLKALEVAQAAYIRARPDMQPSPVAIASAQAGVNPLAALIALLTAAVGAKVIQAATRNLAEERRTLDGLNEALRRLRDFVETLKPAAQASVATVMSASLLSELGGLLGLKGPDLTALSERNISMIRTAIGNLIIKYPNKCTNLESDYKKTLMRLRGGGLRASNMIQGWNAFLAAAVALVKCLLKGTQGNPPGAPAAG